MEDLKNEKDSIKKIYGNENLKEILGREDVKNK